MFYFVLHKLMEPMEMGIGFDVVDTPAKVEIWSGPCAVSPQVNGSNLGL
jgi:hypothetical protein